MAASEATAASKHPQRSNMASDLKSVTPITYLFIFILLIWYAIWALMAASEATIASKQPEVESDLIFEISDLNYLLIHVHIVDMV